MEKIELFKTNFLNSDLKVTPKIHAIFYHITDFCEMAKVGLGVYNEQASESVHYDFLNTWKNYKVNTNHHQFGDRLLSAVKHYNAIHFI